MDIGVIYESLSRDGIAIINAKMSDNELLVFAKRFGTVVPDDNRQHIQILTPKNIGEGIRDSFAYTCGLGNYPYHTDTAFWGEPARYLLLKSEYASSCNTYYLSFNDIFSQFSDKELMQLEHSCCLIKTFNQSRFTSIRFIHNGTIGYRYDPNTLTAHNIDAEKCLNKIDHLLKDSNPQKVEWTGDNFIILDNWKGIHARGAATNDKERILKRIYIK